MLKNPPASDYRTSPAPLHFYVHRIPLSVRISIARVGVPGSGGFQEHLSQGVGISGCHSESRSKDSCFVLAFVMKWTETIVA